MKLCGFTEDQQGCDQKLGPLPCADSRVTAVPKLIVTIIMQMHANPDRHREHFREPSSRSCVL